MVHTLLRSSPCFRALLPALLPALLATSLGAAGCFTTPINRAPVVTKVDADGVPLHGQAVTLTAHGYDPDEDQLTWTWAMTPYQGSCPNKDDPTSWPLGLATRSNTASPSSYQVPATMTSASWCVWAIATDHYGAVGVDVYPLVPSNNPPRPALRVVSPDAANSYQAYTHFVLGADQTTDADNDSLTYRLSLTQAPLGSTASLQPCGDPSISTDPRFQCLDAVVSGQYIVSLAVDDATTTQSTSLTLDVLPDQPPCIAMTTPMYGTPLLKDDPAAPGPIMLNMVTDDGDPYPNSPNPLQTVKFTWFKGKNDSGSLQYVENGSFSMLNLVATDYQPGDVANVRLEVHDRNTAAIDAILLGCGDAPFCPIAPGATCFVRVSWRIEMDL